MADIEKKTLGQSENPDWFSYRKHVITASKGHDVKTQLAKLKRLSGEKLTLSHYLQKLLAHHMFHQSCQH